MYFNFLLLLLNLFKVMLSFHDLFTVLVGVHHLFLLLATQALAECPVDVFSYVILLLF